MEHLISEPEVATNISLLNESFLLRPNPNLNIVDYAMDGIQNIVRYDPNKKNGVQCVLSCIKYFYEQNFNKKIWDKFAQKFAELCVMCLNECVVLNKQYYKVENVLVCLPEVVSELLKQSEFIVTACHYLMVPPLIRIITTEDFLFTSKYSLVKTLFYIIKCSTKDDHSKINPHFQKDIANYANWILMCGDFETQIFILKTLLYFLSGIDNKYEFCVQWFDFYPEIKTDFSNRDFSDFELDSRLFLNLVNKLNKKPRVYSLGCVRVSSNGIKLEKPNDSKCLVFWVDFNIDFESVSIHIQGTNEKREIFQIHNNVVNVCSDRSKCYLNKRLTPVVILNFDIPHDLTKKCVEISFEISEDFHNLENNFLIPVYGFRYVSNWKVSMSNSILPNEVKRSDIDKYIRFVDRNISFPTLDVVIPRKPTTKEINTYKPQVKKVKEIEVRAEIHNEENLINIESTTSSRKRILKRPVNLKTCDEQTKRSNLNNHKGSKKLESIEKVDNQSQLDSRQVESKKTLESNDNIIEPDTDSSDELILLPVKRNRKAVIQKFPNVKNEKKASKNNQDKENKTYKPQVNKIVVRAEIHNEENLINIESTTSSRKRILKRPVNLKTCDEQTKLSNLNNHKGSKKLESIEKVDNQSQLDSRQIESKKSLESNDNIIEPDTDSSDELILLPVKRNRKAVIQKFPNVKNEKKASKNNQDKENETYKPQVNKIVVRAEIHNEENLINIESTTSSRKRILKRPVNLKTCDEQTKLSNLNNHKGSKKLESIEKVDNQSQLDSRQIEKKKTLESNDNIIESDTDSSGDWFLPPVKLNRKAVTHRFSNVKNVNKTSKNNQDKENKTFKPQVNKVNEIEVRAEIHNEENLINIESTTSSRKTIFKHPVNLKTCDEQTNLSNLNLLKKRKKKVRFNLN